MPNRKQPSRLTWNYKPFQALEGRFLHAKQPNLKKLINNIQAIEIPNKNRVRQGRKNFMIKELRSRLKVPGPMNIGFSGGVGQQRSRKSTAASGALERKLANRYQRQLGFGTLV